MKNGAVACTVGLVMLAASAAAAQQPWVCISLDEQRNSSAGYLRVQLEEAGYQCEPSSLARALTDPRQRIATTAAGALAEFSPTPEVIAALRRAIAAHPADLVAIAAVRSLRVFGASGWEAALAQRFHQMDDRDSLKLTAAGLLAQAGRTDGWPFIEGILRGPLRLGSRNLHIASALRQAIYFHGLRDAAGQVIDAGAWADAVLARARAGGIPDIDDLARHVQIVKEQRAGTLPLDAGELAVELQKRQQAGTFPR